MLYFVQARDPSKIFLLKGMIYRMISLPIIELATRLSMRENSNDKSKNSR